MGAASNSTTQQHRTDLLEFYFVRGGILGSNFERFTSNGFDEDLKNAFALWKASCVITSRTNKLTLSF